MTTNVNSEGHMEHVYFVRLEGKVHHTLPAGGDDLREAAETVYRNVCDIHPAAEVRLEVGTSQGFTAGKDLLKFRARSGEPCPRCGAHSGTHLRTCPL